MQIRIEHQGANRDNVDDGVEICIGNLVDQHESHIGEQTESLSEVGPDEYDDIVDNVEDDEVREDSVVNTNDSTAPIVAKRHRRPPQWLDDYHVYCSVF